MSFKPEITYGTKEELQQKREAAFLALSPVDRLLWFFRSIEGHNKIFGRQTKKENFIVRK